ncbi:putative transmembrane protein [Senna tora]|uniref:Putative transmembrane protein n=1 Tax=Senna tora TaxID=362788 RepID=A0A834W0N5_9FABA|nr:putative transmembrane protein [Senna tora]
MSLPYLRNSRVSLVFIICWIFFTNFPGFTFSAVVTLSSIEIFKTHEWLKVTPTLYFLCKAENKTVLPDVKKAHLLYTFKGEESWQPLTNFSSKKCKRCGIYEENSIIADDVYEEWEFCPSDFTTPQGIYVRFKEKKFNATFLCPECLSLFNVSSSASHEHDSGIGRQVAVVVLLSSLTSTILIIGMVGAYKYWQMKKRLRDQSRFVRLSEDGDDGEVELGLGTIL